MGPEVPSRTVSADELPANLRRMLLQAEEKEKLSRQFQCIRRISNCSACDQLRGSRDRDESTITNISALNAVSEGALVASALVRDFSIDFEEGPLCSPRVKAATL